MFFIYIQLIRINLIPHKARSAFALCFLNGGGNLFAVKVKFILHSLDKTYTFVYNEGGNIVTKKEYTYTEGELGTPTKTYSYTYGNTWKDQLTSFDGQSVIYDASGNPTSYMGATLAWNKGRLLTQYSNENKLISMQYDADGIRRSRLTEAREVLGIRFELTDFLYDSQGRLRTESDSTYTRHYLYSNDGIIGFEEDGENYLYRKNLFGDITAIYHGSTKVAEYVYDAWGNCTITYDPDGIGARNPFRYRGYYWDNDIQMYYLMTRYYDPKTGRFINADSIEYLNPNAINGLNLYAYCGNNPVMYVDPSRHEALSLAASMLISYAVMFIVFGVIYLCASSIKITPPKTTFKVEDFLKNIIKDFVEVIEVIVSGLLRISSSDQVETIADGLLKVGPPMFDNAFDYNRTNNPNGYVGWDQRSPGYFGIGGTIAGDPLLYTSYTSSDEMPFLYER